MYKTYASTHKDHLVHFTALRTHPIVITYFVLVIMANYYSVLSDSHSCIVYFRDFQNNEQEGDTGGEKMNETTCRQQQ